uniref:CCHC-type domain-containing protein n=1 Tax=Callithrix jacchus TaxID=9483 RepID=A0A8I3X1C1_CALJA
MGNSESKIPLSTPLGCLLRNFTKLGYSQTLRKKKLVFLSQVAWPQYKLSNQSHWPPTGTFDFNTLRDLDDFCRRAGKDNEIAYVQAFWDLRTHPDLCSSCSTYQILLARTPHKSSSTTFPPPYSSPEDLPEHLSSPANLSNQSPSTARSSSTPSAPPASEAMPRSSSTPSEPPPSEAALPLASPVAAHTRSHRPAILAPLREVAGVEGLVRVHVPFSLQDLSQIERRLGSFSAYPSTYIKEFQYLTQAYSLTWHDIHVVCSSTLTVEEHECILAAARNQADKDHAIDNQIPLGPEVIPGEDPQWDYQANRGSDIPKRDRMIRYLLRGMDAVSNKVVNYDKLREITQLPDENPALFLARLQEALVRYTRLDPASQNGATVLASHFISQSAPNIRKKLKKAEEGPETPIQDLVKMAFKVFNAREDAAEAARQTHMKQKAAFQTQALVAALRPAGNQRPKAETHAPPGACFKCGKEGHWSRACPQPRPPTKPCPICQLPGHWKSDCPSFPTVPVPQNRHTGVTQPAVTLSREEPACQEPTSEGAPFSSLLGLLDD